jgi:transposase
MIPKAAEVRLTPEDRAVLEARVRAPTTEQRDVFRARIVLLASDGLSTREIARVLDTMPRTVSLWRGRFSREGLAGLNEKPRPGPAPKYTPETGRRILAILDRPPPTGFGRWTGPLIAAELGDVHEQQVWRFLRAQKIDLAGRKSWCESNDPEFVAKAADVVGLYMAPPENAIVICVDEKPSIQALERAQGYLKLPNGRALTGHSHNYKRNGTSTLFAAFEVATGKVCTAHKNRRRRIEFLDFMNDIVSAYPNTGTAIHVILDNLSTHKPKNDRWLKRHANVRFHYTPTGASWLNQVEIWFSILQRQSLHGASFTSVKQLREHIDAFIEAYNQHAKPFVWTKAEVHQKRLQRRISQL